MRGKTLNQYMAEQLKNDEFRKEWEYSQTELDEMRATFEVRVKICAKAENKIGKSSTSFSK